MFGILIYIYIKNFPPVSIQEKEIPIKTLNRKLNNKYIGEISLYSDSNHQETPTVGSAVLAI